MSYTLRPWYRSPTTIFDVQPSSLPVVLSHASMSLPLPFSLAGFSVSGRVEGPTHGPIEGVLVMLDGRQVAVTDADGHYAIDSITSGVYTFTATKPHMLFATLKDHRVLPSSPTLPPISVTRYSLCGAVKIDQVPSSLPLLRHRDVVLTGGVSAERQTTTAQGNFCFDAAPGTYYLTPTTTPEERAAGLLLQPQTLSVTITDKPTLDANFIQLVVSVGGAVECLSQCQNVVVTMTRDGQSQPAHSMGIDSTGNFEFKSVMPGEYTVRVQAQGYCWLADSHKVVVGEDKRQGVRFRQSGYSVSVDTTHPLNLDLTLDGSTPSSHLLATGHNSFCLPSAGVWQLTPRACFKFEREVFEFDTANPHPIQLTATLFRVSGVIKAPRGLSGKARAVVVAILDSTQGTETVANLLPTDKEGVFEFEAFAQAGTELVITPQSDEDVLFYPRSANVVVVTPTTATAAREGNEECGRFVGLFVGRAGLVLDGNVSPPIQDVQITITTPDREVVASAVTGSDGNYYVGKLYDDTDYAITASLPGYHFTPVEGMRGYFTATRLTSLVVKVVTESEAPLEGALLSLSSKSFRSNNPTQADGTFTFSSLLPSTYHLRPFMKEYLFTPETSTVVCSGQAAEEIHFVAKRVGYSVFGSVLTVAGQPLASVGVVALSGADGAVEELTHTDAKGRYRLRGLVPGRRYSIALRLKEGDVSIERSSPESFDVTVANTDLESNDFIVFPSPSLFHITGVVGTTPNLIGRLVVELALKSSPKQVIASVRLDHSRFFSFPMLEPETYTVSISCDLDATYWVIPNVAKTVPLVNSDVHVQVQFEASPKKSELDDISSAGSFFSLLMMGTVFYGLKNHQSVWGLAQRFQAGSSAPEETQEEKDRSFAQAPKKSKVGKAKKK